MASSDWIEVQRLAAEFQRAQLSSALQKLSERNCIEIVSKLIDLKLIDVFYTNDGKEYITLEQLSREICDELYLHGGRISLTDLVPILNISYHAIESRAQNISQTKPEIHLVSGQLIDDDHLDHIAEEINENLQQTGQITVVELTKQYELPMEFILQQIRKRLGTIIQGQQDKYDHHVFFTEGFLARNRARIRGALSAITVPTSVSAIIAQNKLPERLFFAVADELISTKRIQASLSGGRQANVATFIPDVHSRSQNEWIDNFLKQNGYLEYAALTRLGLGDPKSFCRKRFRETSLLYLSSCCVGSYILQQIEAAVEEALVSQSWVEVLPLLPSVFDEEDAEQIIQHVLKNSQNLPGKDALVIGHSAVTSNAYVQNLRLIFKPMIEEKASEVVASGDYLQALADQRNAKEKSFKPEQSNEKKDRKDERRKKANEGKLGGGTQGRETKTRATKKKYQKGKNDSDDEGEEEFVGGSSSASTELQFMSLDKISNVLRKQESLSDAPDEFVEDIAQRLYPSLQSSFQEAARLAFEAVLSATSGQRRQTHSELQNKVQLLLQNIKQGEKAIQFFASLDIQQQLSRHLLKTAGSELVNELVSYVSQDTNVANDSKDLSLEARQKIINGLPQNIRVPLQGLHKASQGSIIEEFLSEADVALTACDVVLRKADKKKDKTIPIQQRHMLIEQLNAAQDAALVLHVAVLLLFHTVTQTVLNASGRFVPYIISFLQSHLPQSIGELLSELQGLVIQELTSKGDEELLETVRQKMENLIPRVREAAVAYKKSIAITQE
ncbi:E3 UFM1-protein ligase 1 [Daphnia magna]|uniref:E3 UFM1-protein ligase 1 homolog n=1 Tax=Daphnia magna TaxID=35525 RepID=A0A162CL84_9CRUS|nr:E3 UFM1-protein ligase 1 [Daphnia magna]CAG4638988.1 EOG090X0267 [Daphnia magna]SVE80609.1 EOG090X0267 [Daphnia magna]SVE82945.1 EOG090X0267 [Daphnia magna]